MIAEALAGKRLLITGSTGFLGTALVERLLRSVPDCELVGTLRRFLFGGAPRRPLAVRADGKLCQDAFHAELLVVRFPGDTSPSMNLAVQGNTAPAPKLSLSATTLSFGNVTVGQSKDLSILVSNTGSAALTISSVVVGGAGFSIPGASTLSRTVSQKEKPAQDFHPKAGFPPRTNLIGLPEVDQTTCRR